ncbi:MAG: phosphoesterase, partial [Spirochaetia bacterium]|nr:phosphoesterase [Spirochaetia bacterium]
MKIIYLTDIHDGLSGLKYIFQNTDADLYMLSGDII